MNSTKIGYFIAECRKEKQITQQELADMLNITNKAVSKWETGNGLPDITILTKLASILGVSVDEILKAEKNNTTVAVKEASVTATTEKLISNSADVMLNYLVHKTID
jgi:transcriptional regulator with XRE-family HTH domain